MRAPATRLPMLLVLLAAVLVGARLSAAEKPREKNLLANGSFEQAAGKEPAAWKTHTWQGSGLFEHAATGRTGERSVTISSESGGDLSWFIRVAVEPFSRYRLSGWIKTENLQLRGGQGALLNIHNMQQVRTRAIGGTRDWTRVEVEFETESPDTLQINCLFGGWGLATGKAWFDDVELELLAALPAEPAIVVDGARRGAKIEKYVYGQFIEHLGRCIYGGIWAEMLEDRKFFDPAGSPASPWQLVGEAQVAMVAEGAFVGRHTPAIAVAGRAPGGIGQAGLGLKKGKQYAGRIWLRGDASAAPIEVSLVWGTGRADRHTVKIDRLSSDYVKTPLEFAAGADSDQGRLEITASGGGRFFVGTVSLMPADNVHGMRSDTLALLKQLDAPIYRWPGGNFVSGYDWTDGIGDPDRRPPRKNPAWKGIEHNDFGLDEFIAFCRALKTEPLVVVNSGLGGVEMAVRELEYANGAAGAPMGKRRAENGHAEPYQVKWWGIGNEMYGGWQLGHMPLEEYTKKHNLFVDRMRAADPSIKVIAVGAVGAWSEGMMRHCADHMDLVSEHFYCQERPGVIAHVNQMRDQVRNKAEAHRRYREEIPALEGKQIRIALDEWNYWYGPHVYGELGTRYFLKDALGIAAGLHEFGRNSEMFLMANYAQTVNVIGCIKTTKTGAALETTGLALMLYRRHFGVTPLATQTGRPLDALAALNEEGTVLTLGVVNPTAESLLVPLTLNGLSITGKGTLREIAGSDPMAYNSPGESAKVTIEERPVEGITDSITIAPYSISLFSLPLAP